jgi:PAS domain S-box-containing protein
MSLQANLYLLILAISAVISASLALYTWRYRQTTGAKPFSLLMFILFEWSFIYLLQIASPELVAKAFWSRIAFLGIVTTPVVWLLFALEYTGRKTWITRPRVFGLFLVPIITTIVIWTNDAHYWFWTYRELRIVDDLYLMKSSNGFWFWVHSAYSYALILAGTILVVRALLHWPTRYRGQMIWILLSVFTPWFANALSISNIVPFIIDITPFAFTITGVGMAFALFRHQLLDLAPIARDVVIEGMKDGMIVLDASDRIVDINQTAQDILYFSGEQEPVGKQLADVLTQWPELIERYQDVTEITDEVTLGEGDAQHWYELNLSPLQDNKNNRIGQLIIVRDITERKQSEEQLRQLSRAVEASPTSIIITDTDGSIQYANPKFTEVTGYTLEEVLGENPNILKTDQTPLETHQQMWEAISSGREWRGEFCNRKKNGETFWELASISPIEDDDGNIRFYVAVKEDITDRKQTQEALRIAYDQAMEASRAKSQLLANVSHELRTPLGGILGYAELLKNGAFGELVEEQTNATEEILQSVHYLTSMVNELLDSAQIQANSATLQESVFSPATLLQQAASGTEILAQKKGLKFTTSIDENLPEELYGDNRRLRQILTNLIGNAIKFTKEGEVRVSLGSPDSEHWVMQVTDTGMGIPLEAQSSIFDPFKQADNAITRDNRGIGLGLSITNQLVELMGGRIMLESQVGKGSTFSVLLPIVRQPAQAS